MEVSNEKQTIKISLSPKRHAPLKTYACHSFTQLKLCIWYLAPKINCRNCWNNFSKQKLITITIQFSNYSTYYFFPAKYIEGIFCFNVIYITNYDYSIVAIHLSNCKLSILNIILFLVNFMKLYNFSLNYVFYDYVNMLT